MGLQDRAMACDPSVNREFHPPASDLAYGEEWELGKGCVFPFDSLFMSFK